MSKGANFTEARVGVGALVIRDGKVLLVRRGRAPGKGFWAIPAAACRVAPTLPAAAGREVLAETGISIRAAEPVFVFDLIERDGEGRVAYHYVIVDLGAEYISGEARAADDAEDARWLAPADLAELNVAPVTLELLRKTGFV